MSFATSLGAFTNVATRPTGGEQPRATAARGLDLAAQKIQEVIDGIETELAALDPSTFETNGHISPVSFGGADRAPQLALHHSRAHGVTADTLNGMLADLRTFQDACRDARALITEADQATADQLNKTQTAVDTLAAGSRTNQAEQTNQQAQQDHLYDTPTEDPTEGNA